MRQIMNKEKRIITPRLVIMLLLAVVVIPMLPLLVSRQWNWTEAWIYAAICIPGFVISRCKRELTMYKKWQIRMYEK